MRRVVRAQTFLEYVLLLSIVGAIITAMSTMIRRGAQSFVRSVADQIGNQQYSDARDVSEAHTIAALTKMETDKQTLKRQDPTRGYQEDYIREETKMGINQHVNMGVSER